MKRKIPAPTYVELWGPNAWRLIHSVAFTYPEQPSDADRRNYAQFFDSLGNVLPCVFCRKHYKEFMAKDPVTSDANMRNTEALARWTVKLHNNVNERTGKRVYSFDEVREMYHTLPADATPAKLADPHFGRAPILNRKQKGEAQSAVQTPVVTSNGIGLVVAGVLAVAGIAYGIANSNASTVQERRRQERL